MSSSPARILVLVAHPNLHQSHVNRPLIKAAQAVPHVQVRDLYALYPDYAIDVAAEQAAILDADLIVWQHPMHWYGMPPLMKLWVDEVLSHGWAYGHQDGQATQALRGKDLWLVVSTGGTEEAYHPQGYNRYFFEAFLPPYEQTAVLCGLRFLPPMVQHGAHHLQPEDMLAHARTYASRLTSYPQWPEIEGMADCPDCVMPLDERPPTSE